MWLLGGMDNKQLRQNWSVFMILREQEIMRIGAGIFARACKGASKRLDMSGLS